MPNAALTPTIFHEEWWLNAATNGHYEIAIVKNGDQVVGRMPYALTKKFGQKWGALPMLTYFLGPGVDEGTGNVNTRFIRRLEITRELIQQLPKIHFLQIKCHRGTQDVIPLQEQKFKTSVQFTYEIPPATKDVLWANIYHKKRRVITRTLETSSVEIYHDIEAFMVFYQANLDARAIPNKLDMVACRRLIQCCIERGRGEIIAVLDASRNLTAAIFYAWDNDVSYHLLTTRSLTSGSGDTSALIWQGAQNASQRGLIFDLGGLATGGNAFFYSGFGGNVEARFVCTRTSLIVGLAQILTRDTSEGYWYI